MENPIGHIINVPNTNNKVKVTKASGVNCGKCYFRCNVKSSRVEITKFEQKEYLNCLDGYYYKEVKP